MQDQKQTLLKWCLGAMAVLGDRNSVMVTGNLSENAMHGLRWMENWQMFSAALLSCCLFPSQGFLFFLLITLIKTLRIYAFIATK